MGRRFCLLLGAVLCALAASSQLYSYTNATAGTPALVAANASGGLLARVNGATTPGSPCGTGFSVTGLSTAAVYSTSLSAVSAQITPNGGYKLSVTGFSVGLRRSATGPALVRLAYSLDGGATWVDKGANDAPNNGGCGVIATALWTLNSPVEVTNVASGIILRIYAFGASSASGAFQVLNLTVNGSVNAVCTPPSAQPASLNLTPSLNSVAGSFTPAANGVQPADAYLVLMSATPSLTQMPEPGLPYEADDAVGNATVVSASGATAFTANGLIPGTPYYFFAFSYVNSSGCYNTVSPLAGSISTSSPPPCTAPTAGVSNLTASVITGSSIQLAYTRGNGDKVLILARAASAVNGSPVNSVSYNVGDQIGSGNFVVYNGTASNFTYTGLAQNTAYHFALYEYNNTGNCYAASPHAGNFTTDCSTAANVSSLAATAGNGQAALRWNNPTAGCLDEVIVVVSNAPINGQGSDYGGSAFSSYTGGAQVVYRGNGSNVVVSNLANGTAYYAKVFSRKGSGYSSGVVLQFSPYDPANGYVYLYGNLHAHSGYSDGNKENTTRTPKDDYEFARDANCMDFLGISEHNHSQAGMNKPDYALGFAQADAVNGLPSALGNSIITLFGMEWGVISGGGHVLLYGFDNRLVGWESGNYDLFCAKSDYPSLWSLINNQSGAFATLAHPSSTDYSGMASAYNSTADNAVVGVAVASGPAMSQNVTYGDAPSSLSYLGYYKNMLAKGYRLGAQMDGDNHYMTFGKANANRMVVMAQARNREALLDGIRAMRFYASEDCNVRVEYKIGSTVMGGSVTASGVPSLHLTVNDPDAGEAIGSIEIWGGAVGGSVPSSPLKTYAGSSSINFSAGDAANNQPGNSTWYYFAIVTEADGNRIVTSPIWYTRNDVALPAVLTDFTAAYNAFAKNVLLRWNTAQEINSRRFEVERSNDGSVWKKIGEVQAVGNSNGNHAYAFTDAQPVEGTNFYRLKQMDNNGSFHYSKVVSVKIGDKGSVYFGAYPNPARGTVNVYSTSTASEKVDVVLMDVSGKVVYRVQKIIGASSPVRIDAKGIRAGMYLLKVKSASGETTEKVMVTE